MMTDPKGKTVVITGATSGIGQAAAIALARQGARVLVVGRDPARGEATVEEMARVGETGEFLPANLLSLKDIARLAAEVKTRTSSLDVLINNAGGVFRSRTMSDDSIEATFALNTVAPFVITSHLHGALARANGRVVNVATGFLRRTRLNVDELIDPPSYSSFGTYSRAKLASIMLTMEQAERWRRDAVSAVAVQPGIVVGTRFAGAEPSRPSLGRRVGAPIMKLLGIGATLEQATQRYQQAAFDSRLASGTYFAWGKVAKVPNQAQDAGVRSELWRLLEKLTRA